MELIVAHSERRYWWGDISRPEEFRAPAGGASFTCLLWDSGGSWAEAQRGDLIRRILTAGCRYLVCGGHTCERWHDDFDEVLASREAEAPQPIVMTTWHTGESVEDVAEFFVLHARPAEEDVREHLVLQVGPEWDTQNELMTWVRGWVAHPYGIDAP